MAVKIHAGGDEKQKINKINSYIDIVALVYDHEQVVKCNYHRSQGHLDH